MQQISPGFAQAISSDGYRPVVSLTVLASGVPVATSGPVTPLGGSITNSRAAAARRTLSLDVSLNGAGVSLIPTVNNTGPLVPFGNEVAVYSGWQPPGTDTPELVPCGVYALETVTVTDTATGLDIAITGYDRAWTMSLRKLLTPYTVTAGTRGDTALSALVTDRLGSGVPQNITPAFDSRGNALDLPAMVFNENTDPWQAVQTIAAAIGYEAFFDATGVFTARPIPDPTTAPVAWSMIEGDGNIATSYTRSLSRNGVCNDFIVTGSGTSTTTPVRGRATDLNPNSPMYAGGAFGDVPQFTNSSIVTTADQALFAAQNQLAAAEGSVEQLTVTVFPCPMFDVDDVIYCRRARAHIDGNYVVDDVTQSLRFDGSTVLTGRRVS